MTIELELRLIVHRSGEVAEWSSANPVLLYGEPGVEVAPGDPPRMKIGDGVSAWDDLPYLAATAAAHTHPFEELTGVAASSHGHDVSEVAGAASEDHLHGLHPSHLPAVVSCIGRPDSTMSMTLGRIYYMQLPVFAVDVQATAAWLELSTAQTGSTATAVILSRAPGDFDLPDDVLASTAVGGIDLGTAGTGPRGASLTSPYVLEAGVQYWVAALALSAGVSAPGVRAVSGVNGGAGRNMVRWSSIEAAPVQPLNQASWPGALMLSSQASIPASTPALYSATTQGPSLWLSVSAAP